MNKTSENISERGNAIFMIILGVALFAALSYAFTSSNRTSTSLVTDEEATAAANQIIAYGNAVKQTVKRLQLRGCDDTEISFENNIVASYINPNAPSSNKCNVFDIAGGGLTWQTFDEAEVIFSGANVVNGIRNDSSTETGTELAFFVRDLAASICIKINDTLNHSFTTNPPIDEGTWGKGQFIGNYAYTNNIVATSAGLVSLKSACFTDDIGENIYYSTLITR